MDKTSEAKKTSQISSRKRLMVIPIDIVRNPELSPTTYNEVLYQSIDDFNDKLFKEMEVCRQCQKHL